MRIVDANVLLYAVNSAGPHHEPSRAWLDRALNGADVVGLSWVVLLAFTRLSTSARIFPSPLSATDALQQVQDWIGAPSAHVLDPGQRHPSLLQELLVESGAAGNLVNDAHLAALAIEHRASLITYDTDFARFPSVRTYRPEELLD